MRAAAPIVISTLIALCVFALIGPRPAAGQALGREDSSGTAAARKRPRTLPTDPEAAAQRAAYLKSLRARQAAGRADLGGGAAGIGAAGMGANPAAARSPAAAATSPVPASGVYAPLQAAGTQPAAAGSAPPSTTPSATPAVGAEHGAAAHPSEASYSRLAHPAVAERLALTDEQRKKVAELIAERAEALAKADATQRDALLKTYEEKLSALLTDEQRTQWAKKAAEPKLRFNFRFQRWADVLEWFARQADLSLVLDAPPPGTFNYSDTREYSPSEAIDLLNGVLMTKGYTLIRHDRMLLVVNLADGIPEGLVPRVTLDELDQRGRFEMVTVMFPLAGRSPTDAMTEIKPLLSPNGKATAMPATGQVLVTDTAGVMRAIDAVIQSMPLSGQAPGGEMPQLVVYPLKTIDPDGVAQVLRTLMPTATFVADSRTNHLSAYAGPTQQGVVKAVIDQMEAENTPDKQPRLEVYPLGSLATRQLVMSLQTIVPRAKLSLEGEKLVALATPADQKLLVDAVTKFGGGTAPENTRQIQAYRLTTADATSAITLLRTLVPNATVTYDAQTRDLVALAVPADQQTIKATLSQLQREVTPAERLEMVAYPINAADPLSVQRLMKSMFPNLQITVDMKAKRLLALATPADQKAIKDALDKIDGALPGGAEQSFNVYPVGTADPRMVQVLLQEQFPDVQLVPDMRAGTILVRARKADQDKIAEAVKQIQTGADQGRVLAVYTLQAPPTAGSAAAAKTGKAGGKAGAQTMASGGVLTVLRMMFPEAQFSIGPDPNKLIAWAKPVDHEGIKKAVEELSKPESAETARRVAVYTLETASAVNALPILRTMFADSQFSVGTDANKIVAYARPADQEAIKAAVEEMSKPEPAGTAYTLEVYTLESAGGAAGAAAGGGRGGRVARSAAAATSIPMLRTMFPNAQFAVGAEPSRLVVWARPADHLAIKKAVMELSAREPAETAPRVEVYTLTSTTAIAAIPVLRGMFPEGQFSPGSDPNQILALARPTDHEIIKTVVLQLSKKEPPETARHVVVLTVPLTSATVGGRTTRGYGATSLLSVLRPMFPDAQFTLGADPTKLVVWARPADQEAVKKAVDEMTRKESLETAPKMVVYTMQSGTATAAMAALRGMFPDAQFSPGTDPAQVVAFARPEDHAAIKLAIDELSKKEPPERARQVVVYTVPARTTVSTSASSGSRIPGAAALMSLLRPMFPDAEFSVGANRARLIVWARAADHVSIKKAIDEMTKKEPPELAPRVVVYTLESTPAASAVPILTTMFAEAQFSVGADPSKVVALARPADHELIKQAVEQMSQKEPPEQARRVAVYTVPSAGSGARYSGAAALIAVLKPMFPDVQFTVGTDPSRLVAWARPAEQEAVKKAVEEMTQKEPPETAARVVVYSVDAGTATAALTALRAMFPGAQFSAGADPGQVVAFARPDDQVAIKVAIEEMAKKEPPEKARKVIVYTVPARTTASTSSSSGVRIPGAPALMTLLRPMFPDAQFTVGSNRANLIVWARPADHTGIKKAIDEMTKKEPPELAPRVVVYTLESAPAASAVPILSTMFAEAQFSVGTDPNKVVALARPADHELIKQAVEQMSKKEPPETARQVAVYTVPMTTAGSTSSGGSRLSGASAMITVLKPMFPDAQFTVGVDPTRLVAWARPADQAEIKKAVDEMAKQEPLETAAKVAVYTVDAATATAALTALKLMFPDSQFAAGADPSQVVAYARPDDQTRIKAAVEEMAKKLPAEQTRQVVVHTVPTMPLGSGSRRAGAGGWITVLKPMFPDAQFTVGVDPTRLVAWARPADQAAIRKAVEELSKREPAETAPTVVVYSLTSLSTTSAIPILQSVYPDAHVAAGSDPSKLIVWARPADHERIKASIEQLEASGLPGGDRVLAIYPMKRDDATALSQMLDPLLKKNVLMVPDAARSRLLVWADPKRQEVLKQMIEQYSKELGKAEEPTSKVYPFRVADPRAAQLVLTSLVPTAQIAIDMSTRSLVVSAMPEDHAKIKATVDEMDREDSSSAPRLVIHRVVASDAPRLFIVLRALFRLRPDVQLSVDEQNNALVAVAPPAQQEIIKALVDQADKGLLADAGMQLELYPLRNVDSTAVMQVLTTLFQKQGTKVQLSVEPRSNQLIAIARPEQQTVIRATVEKMRGEERDLEIFQLEVADAMTVQTAIDQLFAENGMIRGPAAPIVDADVTGQQLFIRATKDQFVKIRDLLGKLGETTALEQPSGDRRNTRSIPFEGDAAATLSEIQRTWSQLRPNPLQITIAPKADAKPASAEPSPPAKPEPPKTEPAKPEPAKPAPAKKAAIQGRVAFPVAAGTVGSLELRSMILAQVAAPPSGKTEPTPSPKAAAAPAEPAPITVTVEDGRITIRSDDVQALDQFETLLRTAAQRGGSVGRNMSVFMLHNAKASTVAEDLQRLYTTTPSGRRGGSGTSRIIAIPDERLNAIVVYSNRADRTTIENLVKTLDTPQVPELLAANRMKLIPVKNTSAASLEPILRNMFKSSVDSFGVEDVTNSIVVLANAAVTAEIERVVKVMDDAAGSDPARHVRIIPLQKSNALRVQQSLSTILNKGGVRRPAATTSRK
jgi:type II secretory pathway component GspD/PulD (secretin)